ncbi:MAG: hypothetical protein GY759_20715 [Chloroflexi bacterium]|nr:hypothetical protein [Chloroflexota bacterium]
MNVRTNIVIDQDLVEQATVRQLRGELRCEGDMEASRMSRFVDEEHEADASR